MSLNDAIAVAFLGISILSLVVQSWALHKLRVSGCRGGVYRTVWCRVGCAVVYVLVGANAIWLHIVPLQTSLLAFAITQGTWIANSLVDVLTRRYQPRHLYRRRAHRR